MEILSEKKDNITKIKIVGRLDSSSSPELEEYLKPILNSVEELIFDLSSLEYISSAGLRILLGTEKKLATEHKKMTISKPTQAVVDVFEITGLKDVFEVIQ